MKYAIDLLEKAVSDHCRLTDPFSASPRLSEYYAAIKILKASDGECKWIQNGFGRYRTDCDHSLELTPSAISTDLAFCCYCGKQLVQVDYAEPAEESEGGS